MFTGIACSIPEENAIESDSNEVISGEIDDDLDQERGDPNGPLAGEVPGSELIESRFKPEIVFQGAAFNRPLLLTNAGDGSGRLFVVEQAGLIYVLTGVEAQEKELFLDIRGLVDDSGNEKGLLGLAFHPDYANNNSFFINYTDRQGTVIAKYLSSGNTVDSDSQEVVLRIAAFGHTYYQNVLEFQILSHLHLKVHQLSILEYG